MPKIEIRERDLTTASNANTTTNAVYIPGYANYGPVNTPILCETVEEFYSTFGSAPYRFRKDYSWNTLKATNTGGTYTHGGFAENAISTSMGDMYEAGDYEKSYLMAERLLNLGLPVYYERVFDTSSSTNSTKWTASSSVSGKYTISAKYTGYAGTSIYYYLTETEYTVNTDTNYKYYTFHIGKNDNDNYGLPQVSEQKIVFTFSEDLHKLLNYVSLVKSPNLTLEDDYGLVTIKFDKSVNSTTTLSQITQANKVNLTIASTISGDDEFSPSYIYTHLANNITTLSDKGEYILKFITTGAYPVFEYVEAVPSSTQITSTTTYSYIENGIATKILEVVAGRGDCTFLLDHTPNNDRSLLISSNNSVFKSVTTFARTPRSNKYVDDSNTFGAMFTPYGIYETSYGDQMLPASFGYLAAYAKQVNLTNNWLATAGVDRGTVPYLKALCQNVTNAIAESYTPRDGVAINPITNIKPYGLIIWGARTLKDNAKEGDLVATSFLNIRQITNDVKRQIWVAAKSLTFEQNSEILWIRFKSKITPLLDNMVNANGLSTYEIRKQKSDKRATVKAVIRLYAIEPVEDWDITVELADSTTVVLG